MKKIFLAVIIGTLVGCTDYLDKYQDDFEDKIVAEDSGNDNSSSSESDALSSANVESSSSAKSSSNANDKSSSSVAASSSSASVESSSSVATSSSSEGPASSSAESSSSASVESSSSVATSSSSEGPASSSAESSSNESASSSSVAISSSSEEPASSSAESSSSEEPASSSAESSSSEEPASSSEGCTGTVIFKRDWTVSSGDKFVLPINGESFKSYYDITNWEGICLEYQSDTAFYFGIGRVSDEGNHTYTAKVTLPFPTQSTRGTQKIYWKDSDKPQRVQQEILSASNIIHAMRVNNLNGITTIYKATAISNEPLPDPTDFFTVTVGSNTVKWKVDDQEAKWFTYQGANCPSGWELPSENDFYNLAKAIDSVVSDVYDTLDFTYTALAKEQTIDKFFYLLSKNSKVDNAYGFWTSNESIIVIKKNDSITNRKRFIMETITPAEKDSAYARVRCIKK